MLTDPTAPGRPFVLHATDEIVSEFAIEPYASNAPLHVVAIRTPTAKYAIYSNWKYNANTMNGTGQERELYDYSSPGGLLELDNLAGHSALEPALDAQLASAIRNELREPVPGTPARGTARRLRRLLHDRKDDRARRRRAAAQARGERARLARSREARSAVARPRVIGLGRPRCQLASEFSSQQSHAVWSSTTASSAARHAPLVRGAVASASRDAESRTEWHCRAPWRSRPC